MKKRGHVGIEAMVILSVLLLLLVVVFFAVFEKNKQAGEWGDMFGKEVVCETVANNIAHVYTIGPISQKNTTLYYDYNVTVYSAGLITVEDESSQASCSLPAGLVAQNTTFQLPARLTFTNINNSVVIEVG